MHSNHWVFPKCFHWMQWIQWQKILLIKRLFKLATSCVRSQDVATAPTRQRQQKWSSNWAQLMLQWLIRFPEFTEFLIHLGKTPMLHWYWCSKYVEVHSAVTTLVTRKCIKDNFAHCLWQFSSHPLSHHVNEALPHSCPKITRVISFNKGDTSKTKLVSYIVKLPHHCLHIIYGYLQKKINTSTRGDSDVSSVLE